MATIDEAQDKLDALVRGKPGVVGTGRRASTGVQTLVVYVSSADVRVEAPREVDGYRVEVVESGPFRRR